MSLPDRASVEAEVAQFEEQLRGAASIREAQAVRDRFLGRKNSVIAGWMQQIAAAPADQKKNIGRVANELKQAIESRWSEYEAAAAAAARPAGGGGGDAPRRRAPP